METRNLLPKAPRGISDGAFPHTPNFKRRKFNNEERWETGSPARECFVLACLSFVFGRSDMALQKCNDLRKLQN